ncbi:hypothetical protein LV84_01720 [Algoriphagus ratkowskyi]|uniref:Uncharacterized protein n=1 Tax=Algoriphagus ratkowskyi TaxID=57028 RepID=A0A2W7T314_9BACT|nr:hypothetical protein LV84_01720 [Algoriphagus ratkowskyi]
MFSDHFIPFLAFALKRLLLSLSKRDKILEDNQLLLTHFGLKSGNPSFTYSNSDV